VGGSSFFVDGGVAFDVFRLIGYAFGLLGEESDIIHCAPITERIGLDEILVAAVFA